MAVTKTQKPNQTNLTIPTGDNNPVAVEDRDVHHMIRTLGNIDIPASGLISSDTADEHVRTWLRAGYTLQEVVTLGTGDINGEFLVRILYVFIRQ